MLILSKGRRNKTQTIMKDEKELFETLKKIQEAYNKGLITGAEHERLKREMEMPEHIQSPKDEPNFYKE